MLVVLAIFYRERGEGGHGVRMVGISISEEKFFSNKGFFYQIWRSFPSDIRTRDATNSYCLLEKQTIHISTTYS